jgi:hypothetical protein
MKVFTLYFMAVFCSGYSYAQQICHSQLTKNTPDSRYQANGSEIKDKQTNLIWQRCALGQTWNGSTCIGLEKKDTWENALQAAKNQTGWRLPNIKELKSLVETACYDPAINSNIFKEAINTSYWSSSTLAEDARNVWIVTFDDGIAHQMSKMDSAATRLVRNP